MYLSNNANVKSGISKWQDTVADCGEILTFKMGQNFEHNITLFLAVYSDEYVLFQHSCFYRRECFVGSIAITRVHCTRGGAFFSGDVGFPNE